MGENGAGKSTLLKMIAGALAARRGAARRSARAVTMGYYAQHVMDALTGDRTVLEELQEHAPSANQGTLRSLAGAFGFHDDDVFKPVRVLSGGEKARARPREAALRRAEPARARRADEPPRHRDQARARHARSPTTRAR